MFCKNCGKNIDSGKKNCPYCGAELESMYSSSGIRSIDKFMSESEKQKTQEASSLTESQIEQQEQIESDRKEQRDLRRLGWKLIIAVIICLFTNAIVISLTVTDKSKTEIESLTKQVEEMSEKLSSLEEGIKEQEQVISSKISNYSISEGDVVRIIKGTADEIERRENGNRESENQNSEQSQDDSNLSEQSQDNTNFNEESSNQQQMINPHIPRDGGGSSNDSAE